MMAAVLLGTSGKTYLSSTVGGPKYDSHQRETALRAGVCTERFKQRNISQRQKLQAFVELNKKSTRSQTAEGPNRFCDH